MDVSLLHEREGNRVLVAAQKAFRPVNGVESPKLFGGGCRAAVNPRTDFLLVRVGEDAANIRRDLRKQRRGVGRAERGGGFLRDQRHIGEGVCEKTRDDGLRGKIRNGDGGFVPFGQRGNFDFLLHLPHQTGGFARRLKSEVNFGGM